MTAAAIPEDPLAATCLRMLDRLQATEAPSPQPPQQKNWHAAMEAAGYPRRHLLHLQHNHIGEGHQSATLAAGWQRIRTGDALIVLVGTRGAGKTLIATEWAKRRVVEQNKGPGRYTKCADLIGDIKATWAASHSRHAEGEQDILRKYRATKYLVIDEFHETGASEWESRTLINLLDHRYDDMLATVLIANMSAEQAMQRINPSILDRANETGGLLLCDWPSFRTTTP